MSLLFQFAERLAWASVQGLVFVLVALWICRWRTLPATVKVWVCRAAWLKLAVGLGIGSTFVWTYSASPAVNGKASAEAFPLTWLWMFLLAIWVVGIAIEFSSLLRRSRAATRWLDGRAGLPHSPEIALLARRVGLSRSPRCAEIASLDEPCVAGVWRPWLLVPTRFDPSADRLATAHELAHIRHCDLVWSGVAALVQAAYWFLPGMAPLYRETILWQEARADATARLALGASPSEMARRVLAAASGRPAFGLSFGAVETERRIRAILEPRRSGAAVLLGVLIALAAAAPLRFEAKASGPRRSRPDAEVYQPVAVPSGSAPVAGMVGPVGG